MEPDIVSSSNTCKCSAVAKEQRFSFLGSAMSPLSISHQIKCHFWLIIYIVAIFPAKPHHSCPPPPSLPPFSLHLKTAQAADAY